MPRLSEVGAFLFLQDGGWYWDRTSDLFRVKEALFH